MRIMKQNQLTNSKFQICAKNENFPHYRIIYESERMSGRNKIHTVRNRYANAYEETEIHMDDSISRI